MQIVGTVLTLVSIVFISSQIAAHTSIADSDSPELRDITPAAAKKRLDAG